MPRERVIGGRTHKREQLPRLVEAADVAPGKAFKLDADGIEDLVTRVCPVRIGRMPRPVPAAFGIAQPPVAHGQHRGAFGAVPASGCM